LLRFSESRCPKCGEPLREERAHYRCESCGIVEACCEGICEEKPAHVERDWELAEVEAEK
jgi:hypothetical protein